MPLEFDFNSPDYWQKFGGSCIASTICAALQGEWDGKSELCTVPHQSAGSEGSSASCYEGCAKHIVGFVDKEGAPCFSATQSSQTYNFNATCQKHFNDYFNVCVTGMCKSAATCFAHKTPDTCTDPCCWVDSGDGGDGGDGGICTWKVPRSTCEEQCLQYFGKPADTPNSKYLRACKAACANIQTFDESPDNCPEGQHYHPDHAKAATNGCMLNSDMA
jgi:hypothetical protein